MTNLTRKIISATLAAGIAITVAAAPSLAKSPAYCDRYARQIADRKANGGNILAGTIIGAGAGALLGAAVGGRHSVGTGAIIGGVGGTAVGAASTESKWQRVYRRNYAECRSW
ncbi:MAG: hypothetical protein HY245_10260 [Rhizobiales bacterium]|nr:hypothetical protein [Hyphomicrobiales bacterium]MBI3673782.1 hypothetical protein [Hyphomicrobiales bacterium]